MKRAMLFLLACVAVGCAPSQVAAPPLADPDRADLVFVTDPLALHFSAGLSDVLDFKVTLSGDDLRVNAPTYCKVDRQDIVCLVPRLPAGRNFVLPMRGSNLNAVATYKRASGRSFTSNARR